MSIMLIFTTDALLFIDDRIICKDRVTGRKLTTYNTACLYHVYAYRMIISLI